MNPILASTYNRKCNLLRHNYCKLGFTQIDTIVLLQHSVLLFVNWPGLSVRNQDTIRCSLNLPVVSRSPWFRSYWELMVLSLGMLIESVLATKAHHTSDTLYEGATFCLVTFEHISEAEHPTT